MDYPTNNIHDPVTGPLSAPLPGDDLPLLQPTVTRAASRTDAPPACSPKPKPVKMIGTPPMPRSGGGNGYPAGRVPRKSKSK